LSTEEILHKLGISTAVWLEKRAKLDGNENTFSGFPVYDII